MKKILKLSPLIAVLIGLVIIPVRVRALDFGDFSGDSDYGCGGGGGGGGGDSDSSGNVEPLTPEEGLCVVLCMLSSTVILIPLVIYSQKENKRLMGAEYNSSDFNITGLQKQTIIIRSTQASRPPDSKQRSRSCMFSSRMNGSARTYHRSGLILLRRCSIRWTGSLTNTAKTVRPTASRTSLCSMYL